ncbi:MAG: hypothetical protein H7Z71_00495 [Moraxellaceae bacterium]|nr:hypothetical protein [Pseudobdellovibrionaceae bacterium]
MKFKKELIIFFVVFTATFFILILITNVVGYVQNATSKKTGSVSDVVSTFGHFTMGAKPAQSSSAPTIPDVGTGLRQSTDLEAESIPFYDEKNPTPEFVRSSTYRQAMTWGLMQSTPDFVQVGCDGKPSLKNQERCNAYHGDPPCDEIRSLLCINKSKLIAFDNDQPQETRSDWSGGEVKLLKNVQGKSLTSVEVAHSFCRNAFGVDWQMASFHDGGGWTFKAKGSLEADERFWVYIRDQNANCWN